MMNLSERNKRKLIGVLVFLGVAFLVFATVNEVRSVMSDEDRQLTRESCANLRLPDSFEKESELNMEKWTTALYSTTYYSADEPDNVLRHFQEQLTEGEWVSTAGSDGSSQFQKQGVSISIYSYSAIVNKRNLYKVICSFGVH